MNWKKTAKRLLFPHRVFVGLFSPAALALLIYGASVCESTDALSIVSYVCSFYALMIVSLRVPAIIRFIRRFQQENRYAVRYASDARLRINLSLYSTFVFNTIYAAFQLGLGIFHRSVWFYSMAGYYLLLGFMRLMLVRYTRTHVPGQQIKTEWKKYRLCGVLLLQMTLVLAVFMIYFVWRIREFQHHEITTIAMAAYTFYSLTLAIVNTVRSGKSGSPVYSAVKVISLVAAVVSMLTLENAMLTAFGQENSELFRRIMLGATGIAVIFTVQGIAVYMINRANRNLRIIHASEMIMQTAGNSIPE